MTLNRTVLLRLNGQGEPIVACSYGQGVLTLPSSPLPDGTPEGTPLFTVRLVITAGSPVARDGLIWTNCPPDAHTEFDRHKFYKKVIHTTFHKDDEIDLDVYKPGPHCFYFSFRNRDGNLETTRKFYFVVPPILRIDGKFVQLNSIALQTVVSKWMGKNWDAVFERIAAKKYNMIHFTPLQHRGESNSPYSIYDQLEFDPDYFKDAKQVEQMVQKLHKKYKALTLTDVVFNHTANNSQWLREHPDSGYNAITAPHLLAAIELDGALLGFSEKLQLLGYPTELKSLDDLNKIMTGISKHVLQEIKLWEFYTVNVRKTLDETRQQWSGDFTHQSLEPPTHLASAGVKEVAQYVRDHAIKEPFGILRGRFDNRVDVGKFVIVLQQLYGCEWSEDILNKAQQILNELNEPLYAEYDADINEAMNQLYNRVKYLRLDDWGPKQGPVTDKLPLTEPYFTRFTGKDGKQYALANNGWIWDGNPLIDFASDKSKAYLRREVIVWGDCVKLRYGAGPFDSPYLWKRMADYVEMNAKIFDGFRIDNCHSTPLHVGEYFLDLARRTNPNLYVVAELFSGSEQMDRLYVERLGLSSLIREAMQACSEGELSALVHKHGGRPIGSYRFVPMDNFAYKSDVKLDENYCSYDPGNMAMKCASEIMIPRILTAVPPHALLMDCTHDNETPNQKRTVEDTLPNAALVALCSSAIGSNFGYDEIFPHLLNLVTESRVYDVHNSPGIGEVKALLNDIRGEINKLSVDIEDSEAYIHHDGQYITFHRTDVRTGKGWYLIARTKFGDKGGQKLEPQVFSHIQAQLLFAYSLERNGDTPNDPHLLKGIPTKLVKLEGFHTHFDDSTKATTVTLPDYFPQGSIAVFNTQQLGVDKELDHFIRSGALKATTNLDFISLNSVLYHSDPEENDITEGRLGTYDIPNFGKLVYCGLQGWISVLRAIIFKNDLAHPLSENLRQGTWALDYLTDRLDYYSDQPGVPEVQQWLRSRFERIKELPFFLRPSYFALVVAIIYDCCRLRAMQLMPPNIGKSTLFVQSLALTSVQMVAEMKSTSIYPNTNAPSMAAGLPHFSTGWARCWGRDVFISLRGLLLTTGRFDVAENHILAFAKTLKHGLIPNLLDSGRNPRYNARDAAWFFIQAVQDYIDIVPNGESILQKKVSRRFPLDDTYVTPDDPLAFSYSNTIEEIIYEIFSRHAKGIKYREANAGPDLDRVMSDKGFNVEVYVDWSTGFIHGGSQFNCGTWMDKMGESKRAGSYGVPGTPRDGAAVEIIGLLKSSLRFIIELNRRGLFKEKSVTKSDGTQISFKDWNQLLQSHFEQKFYIPKDSSQDSRYEIDRKIVNRRGIYKDLYHTGKPYEDYELRPNFLIAMTVAPELFTPRLALDALIIADQVIKGPLGMKTLDPSDYNYRPYYINGEDSDDFATAKGRNYHQGPEWVWLYGFFLRAFSKFHWLVNPQAQNRNKTKPSSYLYQELFHRINRHAQWIAESPWAGITELTNKDGEFCNDSSPTQAWSTGCLLDMYYDMWRSFES